MRKIAFSLAAILTALLLLPAIASADSSPSQANAAFIDPDEGWALPNSSGDVGSQNALFIENSGVAYSALIDASKLTNRPGVPQGDPTCSSTSDEKCNFSNFSFTAQIPVCQMATDQNCIESIGAIDEKSEDHIGAFQSYYPAKAQNEFVGNPAWKLPSGVSGSLFTIPGANGATGNTYYVSVVLAGHGNKNQNPITTLDGFTASITPVQIQDVTEINRVWCKSPSGTCDDGWNLIDPGQNGNLNWGTAGGGGDDGIHSCAATSWAERSCAEKQAFPSGFKFYTKARFTLPPTGWLHGRLDDPTIILTESAGVTKLTVQAAPVVVPLIYKNYLWSKMPAALQDLYDPKTGNYKYLKAGDTTGFGRTEWSDDPLKRAITVKPKPYDQSAIAHLAAWLPWVENTATAIPHYWSLQSLSAQELAGANPCFTNPLQLNGIVTTNATTYAPGPPVYDKGQGDLNYQVAAPHFAKPDVLFKGLYDLVMRSNVARCVYGFSNAPIKASVSVISASGAPQVATTVIGEKDGWLHLSARNFEFSAPTVKVNLSQEEEAPAIVVTPQKVAPKKISIICHKGKVSKTISGNAPKCPAGFKLKK
jgi:hypothetical protein